MPRVVSKSQWKSFHNHLLVIMMIMVMVMVMVMVMIVSTTTCLWWIMIMMACITTCSFIVKVVLIIYFQTKNKRSQYKALTAGLVELRGE